MHPLVAESDQDAHVAVDLAQQVRSQRVMDRLAPLLVEAKRHSTNADAAGLAERIVTLRAA
jgi:hypothetical protein